MILDLEAIKARTELLVAGPWVLHDGTIYHGATKAQLQAYDDSMGDIDLPEGYGYVLDADFDMDLGEFVAHAREDVPALLAEVERLHAAVTAAVSAIDTGDDGDESSVDEAREALWGVYRPEWDPENGS